jgi:hypothetical protein
MVTFTYTLKNLENAHNRIYISKKRMYRKIWGSIIYDYRMDLASTDH